MVRTLIKTARALSLLAILAACQSDSGGTVSQSNVDNGLPAASAGSNAGDNRVAKTLFGAISTPSQQRAEAIGFYSRGCQAGAVALPETGPTWQVMRLSRNRNWGQPTLIDYLQTLSRNAAAQPGWAGIYVGDMAQPRGGPMLTGHASHQSGLDADIWLYPPPRLDLSRQEREDLSAIRMDRTSGAYVNSNWTPQHEAVLRAAASDPRVDRIFIFPGAKVEMCNNATGDRSWLQKVRPWYGHNYHFHVRLRCDAGDPNCETQAAIPPGDGCADAQEWVNNIINPPPPDPNYVAPPPRGPVTMAQLPAQCSSVLTSN